MLTHEDVVEMARGGRVAPAPNFHARSAHGATFERLAQALLFTFRVNKDPRPEHPDGYIAIARKWGGDTYRIDFNVATDAHGGLILIVTDWKYGG